MLRLGTLCLLATAAIAALALADEHPPRRLQDYRYFRALSIDLAGRVPTRDEVADFSRPDFDLDGWIEQHLTGPAYAERLRRVYMDLLRLEIGPSFQFVPNSIVLRRETVMGPDGKDVYIYYRRGQRRVPEGTDGSFCLTPAETGLEFPPN